MNATAPLLLQLGNLGQRERQLRTALAPPEGNGYKSGQQLLSPLHTCVHTGTRGLEAGQTTLCAHLS